MLSALINAGPVKYNDRIVRFLVAPVAAHIIITFDENETVLQLLQLKEYYIALVTNTLMAVLVIEPIAWVTRKLDKSCPWLVFPIKRLFHQVFKGVLIPLVISVFLAVLYFGAYNIHIRDTVYFDQYFLIIVFMIISVNAYYVIYFGVRMAILLVKISKRSKKIRINNQLITYGQKWPTNDIAFLFSEKNGAFVITSEKEKLVWPDSLVNTISNLSADDYFMINRAEIVRADVIAKVSMSSSRRVKLTLVAPLDMVVYVSQRNSREFKRWWQKYTEQLL